MTAIWKRELQAYFVTASGYIFMGVFLTLASVMFYLRILQPRSSDLLTFMGLLSYLWMLLCPVLTMRLFAEERQKKTDRLLFTSPVSLPGAVLGKFLAACSVMLMAVVLTGAYVLVVAIYGAVYPGEMLVGYLGFILQGCAVIAVDLFVSARCASPVSAAVAAIGVNFCLWMMDALSASVPVWLGNILNFVSLYARNEPFLMGQLSFASVGFDLSVTAAMLALVLYTLDSRRSKGA